MFFEKDGTLVIALTTLSSLLLLIMKLCNVDLRSGSFTHGSDVLTMELKFRFNYCSKKWIQRCD
ncbi:hypothetical protein Bca4012_064403 [Brassica carinata]